MLALALWMGNRCVGGGGALGLEVIVFVNQRWTVLGVPEIPQPRGTAGLGWTTNNDVWGSGGQPVMGVPLPHAHRTLLLCNVCHRLWLGGRTVNADLVLGEAASPPLLWHPRHWRGRHPSHPRRRAGQGLGVG